MDGREKTAETQVDHPRHDAQKRDLTYIIMRIIIYINLNHSTVQVCIHNLITFFFNARLLFRSIDAYYNNITKISIARHTMRVFICEMTGTHDHGTRTLPARQRWPERLARGRNDDGTPRVRTGGSLLYNIWYRCCVFTAVFRLIF